MAARLRKNHQDEVREKIRASQLVNRLEDHVLGDVEMTSTQVTAALGLLKKCVPDLSQQNIDANVNHIGLAGILAGLGNSKSNHS